VVDLLYRYLREERLKHPREPGVYWVTDLVACSLKARFEREYAELSLADLFNPVLVQGLLTHVGLEALLSRLLEAEGVRVEVEPEAQVEVDVGRLGLGSGRVVVRGRIDVVLTGPRGERCGIEIKTARSDLQLPLEHHVDQVRAYNTLFDLPRSYLVYVTPERVTQFEVAERMGLDEIARRALEPRAPRYPWECRYCHFSVLCPSKVTRAQ